jgi:peptide/nickel transport system substrate-binding protein
VEVFQDHDVRAGMAHCLQRGLIAPPPWLVGEPGVPATYLPVGHPQYNGDAQRYNFSPETGRGLLSLAGWTPAIGTQLSLTLAGGPVGNPGREWLLEPLARNLQNNCNVSAEVRPLTSGELEADWPDGVIFGRRFDLAVLGWRVPATPLCGLFTTAEIPTAERPGGANAAGYSSGAFDEACRRANATLDPAQSAAHHAEAQRLFAEDLPAIPLFAWPRYGAARPQVTGYQLDANSPSELWNIEEWYKLAE